MTQEEIHKNIEASSNELILRRQLELLAEYSRTYGTVQIPECSEAMVEVYRELAHTEAKRFLRPLLFGVCASLLYGISVKLVELRRGK